MTERLRRDGVWTIGHSRGSSPALRAARIDPRITGAVGLDALGSPAERNGGLGKPLLNIRSDDDWSTREPFLRALYSNVTATTLDAVLAGGGHDACTDMPALGSEGDERARHHARTLAISKLVRAFSTNGAILRDDPRFEIAVYE